MTAVCVWVGTLFMLVCPAARAQEHSNPATYISLSGRYELLVDHSERDGSGPANYRLTLDGVTVWAGERQFSLWDARVADNGTVAGYAYSEGVRVGGHHGTECRGLCVVILAPDGEILVRDPSTAHEDKVDINSWSGSDSPTVRGIILDEPRDRFVVRVPLHSNGGKPPIVWWVYELSSGRVLDSITPEYPRLENGEAIGIRRDIYSEIVPDTPLVLVHWITLDFTKQPKTWGAVLALLDVTGHQVWSREFPGEYDSLGEDWSWYWDLVKPGIEQATVGPHRFEFQSYSLDSRLIFSLTADPQRESGWSVVEAVRAEDGPPTAAEADLGPAVDEVALEFLGEIPLETGGTKPSPIGDIMDFAIDPEGNVGFVRHDTEGRWRFVRVSPTGEILSNFVLALPVEEGAGAPHAGCVSSDRWVLVRSMTETNQSAAWWFEPDSGALDPIEGFRCGGQIESLVPTEDGGFLIHSKHYPEYTIQDELACYSAEGKRLWSRLEKGFGQGLNIKAATWITGEGVAALTAVSNTIEFFDTAGAHLRSVKVADLLGAKPNYPAGLVADVNGGLILHDFNGVPPIYRIDREGEVAAKFQPRYQGGGTFRIIGDVKVAPDGTLWTSDRYSLLRLGNDGVVAQALGQQPDDDSLGSILAMAVHPDGQIYAVNTRTAAVHVFSEAGELLRLFKPLPTDFPTDPGLGSITVDGEGSVYYHTGSYSSQLSQDGYMGFLADGTRLGFKTLGLDVVSQTWLFKPGSLERWVLGYQEIWLLDAQGGVAANIDRRPDNDWLHRVNDGAVAPDGSLAVVSGPDGLGARGPFTLNIYEPNGKPGQSMPLASDYGLGPLAFDGETVVVSAGGALDLHRLADGSVQRFVPPSESETSEYWFPHFSPDGDELWLLSSRSTKILRFAMP